MRKCTLFVAVVVLSAVWSKPASASYVSTSFGTDTLSYGFSTNRSNDMINLGANYSTRTAAIDGVSIWANQYSSLSLDISIGFNGVERTDPTDTLRANQSMEGEFNGRHVRQYVGTGYYDVNENGGGKGMPTRLSDSDPTDPPTPAPIWWANGYASLEFDNVSGVSSISASGSRYTYTWIDKELDEKFESYTFNPHWIVTFETEKGLKEFSGSLAAAGVSVTSVVPEPAGLGVLAFGTIGLLARRRRSK